jgi:glutaminyl-tRNA synthetase
MIRTRFPPEPNGYLHMGHVKAMLYDFEHHPECECILRFDDTNPETERAEFVDSIIEDVAWLGFNPVKITYTSDYFDALYSFAETLIQNGKAYVDFTCPEDIKKERAECKESRWRNLEPEVHLEEFRKMRDGVYEPMHCVLRLKIDMAHENAVMRDPIAYRINKTPHYRTGTTWCIYPSYDYSHGIVDALENITHSYCTSEFYIRRELYMWPIHMLGLIPATVIEFGRLNVEGISLSKRKIIPRVESGELNGYDDPRLFTIRGLRRRGFSPAVLKTLAGISGLDRHDTILSKDVILHHLRCYLYSTAPKSMAVLDPLTLKIRDGDTEETVYIERTDFRDVDSPEYYRLAPGKTIRLRNGPFLKYVSHTATEIIVEPTTPPNPKKIKGIIHWVAGNSAVPTIFETYDDINTESKLIKFKGYTPSNLSHDSIFQFERMGYFRLDRVEDGKPVFIKIVALNDSPLRI